MSAPGTPGWLAAGQASQSVSGPRPIPGEDINPFPFQAVMVQVGMGATRRREALQTFGIEPNERRLTERFWDASQGSDARSSKHHHRRQLSASLH